MTKEELELLADFLTEANEELEFLETNLVELERDPTSKDIINKIFRSIHSIKGSSGFFGLESLTQVAHKMETLLDYIRKGVLEINQERTNALLKGLDILKAIATRLSDGTYKKELQSDESAFLVELDGVLSISQISKDQSLEGAIFLLNMIEESVNSCEYAIEDKVEATIAILEGLKDEEHEEEEGVASEKQYVINGKDLTEFISRIYALKDLLSEGTEPSDETINVFTKEISPIKAEIEGEGFSDANAKFDEFWEFYTMIADGPMEFDNDIRGIVVGNIDGFLELVEEVKVSGPEETPQATEEVVVEEKKEEPQVASDNKLDMKKTMRVEEDKIDNFIKFVGDLIVASEVFNYIQKKLEITNLLPQIAKEFKNANLTFNELSNSLQTSLMDIRKVPVSQILKKVPRMVRDLSGGLNKKIRVEMYGEESEIDKSLIEVLEAPIVHMIRNSLDHGIESAEGRREKDKPEEGTITLRCYVSNEFFNIEISDDGKGLDPAIIKKVAIDKGVITPQSAEYLTDQEAINLIFMPGFSTAETVTDVSGRGVGMDVVLSAITKNNGSVNVSSVVNEGSTVKIQLPVSMTMIVVDGLLITVGQENFIIPLNYIQESIQPKKKDVLTVSGKGEMIRIRENCLPLLRLHELFSLKTEATNPSEALLIVVKHEQTEFCILVDELLGQQQVVLKELGTQFKNISSIKGGAILGDGKVGLVLDIEGLADMYRVKV